MSLLRAVFGVFLVLATTELSRGSDPVWRWSNPTPHGVNIYGLASRGSTVVQVGEFGHAFASDDLDQWRPLRTGVTNTLRSAVWFGARLIVTGSEGLILYSDNVNTFVATNLATSDWIEGVAASDTRLLAVGDNGATYTSTDGGGWVRLNNAGDFLRSVAWGNGKFVAVGDAGFVTTSGDGLSWTSSSRITTRDLNRVVYIDNKFWILGNQGTVFRSSSGSGWSVVNVGTTNDLFSAASDGNLNVVVGREELRTSSAALDLWSSQTGASPAPAPWTYYTTLWDGAEFLVGGRSGMFVEGFKPEGGSTTQWFSDSDSPRNWMWGLACAGGIYAACGEAGGIFTSADGYRFDQESVPQSAAAEVLEGIGGTSNLLVTVGTAGIVLWSPGGTTNVVTTDSTGAMVTNQVSLLGLTWNAVSPRPTANELQGVGVLGSTFIVTGGNGTILTSADGQQWASRTSSSTKMLSSVATSATRAVAVGDIGTILTSDNAISWTKRVSGVTNWIYQARYLNGMFVAVGEAGIILTSPDGATWTVRNSGTTSWLNSVDFQAGNYYAVGTGGQILRSPDAINWTPLPQCTNKSLYGLAGENGQMVTVGIEGAALRTRLTPWTAPVNFVSLTVGTNAFAYVFSGELDERFTVQKSADMKHWGDALALEIIDNSGIFLYYDAPALVDQLIFRTRVAQP